MKKIITCLILIATITFLSCEKDPDTPANFIASQGTYMGVVHIAYGDLDGQAIVYRFNEDNANWDEISWTWSSSFEDNGHDLPAPYIVPGKKYRYKMRVYIAGQGNEFSGYTSEITGYAFKGEPAEITAIKRKKYDKVDITISWRNPNDLSEIKNLDYIEHVIYRAENGNLSDYYYAGSKEQMVTSPSDIQYEWSYIDTWLDPEKTYSYKIKTRYHYHYTTVNGDYRDNEYYEIDGTTVEEDGSGDDDNPVINYTTTDLGQLIAAASGDIIVEIKEKVVNGDVYLGVITGNTVEATPALFKYNGSAFENVWTCDDLSSSKGIHYAITSSGTSYVAGHGDSLCIYRREGSSWSQDIAPDNMDVCYGIEVFNDELYLFAKFDDLRQVMKYNGTSWDKTGETIASGSVYDANIETIDGNLYVHYTIDNTLYIKHLSGNSWVSDLEWTQEWLSDIQLAKNGGDLFFSTSTANTSEYDGGVYKVTSTTSVENFIPDDAADSWFLQGAFTMSVDVDGNLITASIKAEIVSDTEVILYPYIALFDGSQWNTVSGDYTDGRDPIAVSTIGRDIIYFYGEKATQNSSQQSTVLKAKKLTK